MLRNADYIYNNIIISDEVNTTKKYCKKAQVGVDLSVKNIINIAGSGLVTTGTSHIAPYQVREKATFEYGGKEYVGWVLPRGTYICELNEGCEFGSTDTGLIIMRSSLNRNGTTIQSAVWDPGFTTRDGDKVNTMSIRLTVDADQFCLEENARVAQLLIFENEAATLYNGQFQNGSVVSKL